MTADAPTTPPCPRCGHGPLVRIAYGLPGPEMMDEAQRGEILLGGCIIDEGAPDWHCPACQHEFPDPNLFLDLDEDIEEELDA